MEQIKAHRIGTFTFGISLIGFGILFLINTVFHILGYGIILKVWPVVFILLGIEILLANMKQDGEVVIYDKAAVAMIAVLLVFAMVIGFISQVVSYGMMHMNVGF